MKAQSCPDKRECPSCKKWYGRRKYKSGQIEPPSNFRRRETCGDQSCVHSFRILKLANGKENRIRSIEAVDLFVYGKRAIRAYHDLMTVALIKPGGRQ